MKLRIKIIISALIILMVFSGIMAGMIFSGSGYKLTARPSVRVFDSVMEAKNNSNALKLNEDDTNSILSMIFKGGITEGDITVYGAEVKINSSDIYIYSPINFRGIKLLLSAGGSIREEGGCIIFKPSHINLGKISLPAHFILSRLEGRKISFFQISGDSIILDKSSLPLNIESIQLSDDQMILKFQEKSLALNEKPKINTDNKPAVTNKDASLKPKTAGAEPKAADKPEAAVVPVGQKELIKLSSQLGSAISIVLGDSEKSILSRVKSSVDKKIANPSYNITCDVSSVKSSYYALTLEQRNNIKGAILAAVNMENAMELREIFGI